MRIKRVRTIHVIQDLESNIDYAVHFNQHGGGWTVVVIAPGGNIVGGEFFFNTPNTPNINDAIGYCELALALRPIDHTHP